jgi:uroporphyrinogen-III synthase
MKDFKDFGIQSELRSFTGEKIRIDKILNRKIAVFEFKVGNSKFPEKGNGKCLTLQIGLGEEKRVVFTSGTSLINTLEQIPKDGFPFSTTIVKEDERLIFT